METGKLGVTEGGNQSAPVDQVGPGGVAVKPEGEKAEPGAIGAPDLAPTVPTPQEESSGRILLNSITSAPKSLEMCAAQLEANASLLETMRADSSSINSLAAGVNYYASTTKAAQAAQSANRKQVAWDWLSSSSDKIPLKDALRSIRHHSECTSKAAYHLVETAKEILDEIKNQKELMSEQCLLLKTVASNQQEPNPTPGVPGAGGSPTGPPACPAASYPPFGSYGTPSTHSTPAPPAFMRFGSHLHAPPQLPPIVGRFWNYQPVVAPNLEPNESRNPPSAAYAWQETRGRQP